MNSLRNCFQILLLLLTTMLAACSSSDDEDYTAPITSCGTAITFSVDNVEAVTTRSGTAGLINDLATLKSDYDFGVMAYYTGSTAWTLAYTTATPNFMYNQQVKWDTSAGSDDKSWTYTPVKYWPNDNQPADNQVPAAQGSQEHNYLTFYGYAPYAFLPIDDTTYGIVGINGTDKLNATGLGNEKTGAPTIAYKNTNNTETQVDLLWATPVKDAYKTMTSPGTYGYVNGAVPINFNHALARIDLKVQRVYNEVTPTGAAIGKDSTKIFVSSVSLASTDFYQTGTLSLDDGSWTGKDGSLGTIEYEEGDIISALRGTTSTDAAEIDAVELTKCSTKEAGVDEIERDLNRSTRSFMLIPATSITVTPSITYSMVTRDDALEVGYLEGSDGHRYSRVVNSITGSGVSLTFEAAKRYYLLLRIGAESVELTVSAIEDWDLPIRFNPSVTAPTAETIETIEKTVNEE